MKELDQKICLVIGGTSGIGSATAIAFAEAGAEAVVLGGRRADEGAKVVSAVEAAGAKALFVETDVAEPGAVKAIIDRTVSDYGRIDAAFNNAGTEGKVAPMVDYDESDFDRLIAINLKGVWLGLRFQIEQMLKQDNGGAIVSTASIGGVVGFPNNSIYCATKHAIIGLTKSAALEVSSKNVRVNAVAPGATATELFYRQNGGRENGDAVAGQLPVGRLAAPEEMAAGVVWLCSGGASYVHGHTLVIDGGVTVGP